MGLPEPEGEALIAYWKTRASLKEILEKGKDFDGRTLNGCLQSALRQLAKTDSVEATVTGNLLRNYHEVANKCYLTTPALLKTMPEPELRKLMMDIEREGAAELPNTWKLALLSRTCAARLQSKDLAQLLQCIQPFQKPGGSQGFDWRQPELAKASNSKLDKMTTFCAILSEVLLPSILTGAAGSERVASCCAMLLDYFHDVEHLDMEHDEAAVWNECCSAWRGLQAILDPEMLSTDRLEPLPNLRGWSQKRVASKPQGHFLMRSRDSTCMRAVEYF